MERFNLNESFVSHCKTVLSYGILTTIDISDPKAVAQHLWPKAREIAEEIETRTPKPSFEIIEYARDGHWIKVIEWQILKVRSSN